MKKINYLHTPTGENGHLPHILNPNGKKLFYVFGDSYCSTVSPGYDHSWLNIVAEHFDAKILIYGIPGASEQTIFYLYSQVHSYTKDLSLIFHTHTTRRDVFFGLDKVPLSRKFYSYWDSLIKENCLHLYWAEYLYKFTNGDSIFCSYPWINYKESIHHMSYKNNELFGKEVIRKLTNEKYNFSTQ